MSGCLSFRDVLVVVDAQSADPLIYWNLQNGDILISINSFSYSRFF